MPQGFLETLFLLTCFMGKSSIDHFVVPPGDPMADGSAMVTDSRGNARFTVLTAHTIRLEYSPTGEFENRQTLVVWNRKLRLPSFQHRYSSDGTLIIDTGALQLRYTGGPFTDDTLHISMAESNLLGLETWTPGLSTLGNLYGTFRAYDGLDGLQDLNCTRQQQWETNNESAHCTFGLISKAGWATFSDARTPVFYGGWIHPQTKGICGDVATDSSVPCLGSNSHAKAKVFNEEQCLNAGCCWIGTSSAISCIQRQGNVDLYFFGHGVGKENYRLALYDFTLIAGKVPLPRRHMLGVSWSRWGYGAWNGSQNLQLDAVRHMNLSGFPLDTFILDMNWHGTPDLANWDGKHGWPINWTGYTWNATLYPNHTDLIKQLHDVGLQVGANLHDSQGVAPHELNYTEMASANHVKDGQTVAFHFSDPTYADSLHKLVLEPLAAGRANGGSGFDFWWTDWQQGLEGDPGIGTSDIAGLNPTMWLNHYRFMNYSGSSRRGQIHSRFGGLGGHRYPSQFGGDIKQGWASMEAVVYTNAIAANVLVAHWAQEIMQNFTSHELFMRMIQLGAWSPVFTIFGNLNAPCNVWDDKEFPDPFRSVAREALVHRSMLLPYRYTLAYEAYRTGLAMVRPMYYDYPLNEIAYSGKYNSLPQYLYGQLLVVPVTKELDHGVAEMRVWFPEDTDWQRLFSDSPKPKSTAGWTNVTASLAHMPVYAPGGAVLPMLPRTNAVKAGVASLAFDPLEWWVLPGGAGDGEAWCYEDDGLSNDYLSHGGVNITIAWRSTKSGCTDWILTSVGDYRGAPDAASRQYYIRLVGFNFIAASVDGGPILQNGLCNHSQMVPNTWCYGSKESDAADEFVLLMLKPGKRQHSLNICADAPSGHGGWPFWGYVVTGCIFLVVFLFCFVIKRHLARRRTIVHADPPHIDAISLQANDAPLLVT